MRRRFGVLLAAASVLATCSCGGARLAPEIGDEPMAPNDGGNGYQEGIAIRDVTIIGGAAGEPMTSGGSAPMYMVLINNRATPDRLVSVAAPGAFKEAQLAGGGVDLPVRKPVGAGAAPLALLTGLTDEKMRSGSFVDVELRFRDAGTARLNVPVLPPTLWRTTLSPWPSPPAQASPSPTAPASPSPAPPASPSPTGQGGTD
ncbi:hypothetical protein ACFOWE_15890 [Planomonospora corallina]|uniref:Copper(I)-binding protein n=1 Tax=Planomonospora corallina TaxID=1806052 RepID=A0ABV8I9Y6_9ACTN